MLKSPYVLSMVSYAMSLWISLLKSFCCKEVPTKKHTVDVCNELATNFSIHNAIKIFRNCQSLESESIAMPDTNATSDRSL